MKRFARSSIAICFIVALFLAGNTVAEHKAESVIEGHNHTYLCEQCAKEKDTKVFFLIATLNISFNLDIYSVQTHQSHYFNTSYYASIRAPPTFNFV